MSFLETDICLSGVKACYIQPRTEWYENQLVRVLKNKTEMFQNLSEIDDQIVKIAMYIYDFPKHADRIRSFFDEKYGDVVRVVNIGDYSIELCGGCHVLNSSEIGLFKIVSEESVGSGIRRIVAQSGLAAYNAMVHEKETVDTIASTLNLKNRKDVVNKVEALKEELKEAKVEVEQLSAKLNAIQAASKANDIEEINGVKVLYVEEQLENAKAKQLTFDFRDQLESGIVVLVSKYEEKCSYFVSVSKDLVGQYKAGNIIKAINEVVDGRGGGKPDFAQGGCAINDNISKIKGALKNIL